jgi:hypothetical protein
MHHPIGTRITIEQRRKTPVDAPVQPMALPLVQSGSDRLNHLLWNQMAIPEPKFIVIA